MKIHRLGIDLDTRCPVCNRLNEDGGHIFLKCKKARSCWSILGLDELRETLLSCVSPRDLLQEIWKCNEAIQVRAVTFLWEWWNIRNKANAGEGGSEPAGVCSRVERLLIDFMTLKKPAKPPKPPDIHKWAKPPENHVKVNFDGSFNATSGTGGWGYVIRDQAGNFIAAGAGKLKNLGSALQSEAVACLAAIRGADRVGANRIIFESDASNLVQGLQSKDYDKSEIGVLVKEARSLCIMNFSSFQFSFSRRTCNIAAHELAKLGANSESEDSYWDVSAPGCIVNILASDLAGPV
jgi:ribonuclease HI